MTRILPDRKVRLAANYRSIGKPQKDSIKPDWRLTEEEIDEGIAEVQYQRAVEKAAEKASAGIRGLAGSNG